MIHFQVVRVKPNDKDAKAKLAECQKVVQRIMFQKAIAVDDDKKSVSDSINLEGMSMHLKSIVPFLWLTNLFMVYVKDS